MTCLRELPAVPDPLALHRHDPARYPCLLESVARGGGNGRWSLVFAFPQARLQAQPGTDFLDRLDAAWRAERLPAADDADLPEGLPFRGGWFVYLGYELAAEVEPVLQLPAATDGLPRACALRARSTGVTTKLAHPTRNQASMPGLPRSPAVIRGKVANNRYPNPRDGDSLTRSLSTQLTIPAGPERARQNALHFALPG
ncbi:MAG TPA: hypothetical protein PLP98_02180, partial [Plasticicumulans sp.]|nr:hypothetical protein [Plasticicumulans sp.]